MRIVEQYSHLNGWEHIMVHKPGIWTEIQDVIAAVDVAEVYSPRQINERFESAYVDRQWRESRAPANTTSQTLDVDSAEQRQQIMLKAGQGAILLDYQTGFIKERVAIEVQIGKYTFGPYDLLAKHMGLYVGNLIDVGVEILPMQEMAREMSSEISYYEAEAENFIRQRSGVPAVPLIFIGITP